MAAESLSFYSALSHAPIRSAGNYADLTIYRDAGETTYGAFKYKAPEEGLVQVAGPHSTETAWSDDLHGVPCNRAQWEDVQRSLGRFCETIAIDMLGMGESTQPRMYGKTDDPNNDAQWHWVNDVDYVEQLMQHEYTDRKFIFIADDWGSGIASHYAAAHNDRLNALIQLDAITFDGCPVNEIQAIGRASQIPNTPEGDAMFAAFDQTLVQILKTMVYDPSIYNQYNLRKLTCTYIDVDYERNGANDGVTDVARSTTLRLHLHNLRVLADRAAILSAALLLPYHPQHNPCGVDYQKITVPTLIGWGEYDNMMPAAQTQRFANVLGTDGVQITYIPNADHFAHTDRPLFVADTIVNFIRRVMADINLDNEGIWKGNERLAIAELRQLHGIQVD